MKIKTKQKIGQWVVFLIAILICFGISYFGENELDLIYSFVIDFTGKYYISGSLFIVLAMLTMFAFIAMFIQIIIHEIGHLLGGLISGYKFVSFRIGKLILIKTGGKIKLKQYSLAGTGGQCLMSPSEPYNEKMPASLYNFGGSLANLIFSSTVFVFNLNYIKSPLLLAFSQLLVLIGFIFAVLNGIPARFNLLNNDGYNAINLKKNKTAQRYFWLQLKINALGTDGIRLKDMPEQWFAIPGAKENNICASMSAFKVARAIDKKDFETARKTGLEALESTGLIGFHRYYVISELIFCELIGENRRDEIENMMTKDFIKYIKSSSKRPKVLRLVYVYELFYNNNEKAAVSRLEQFEKAVKNYPYEADIESDRELIAYAGDLYKRKRY